VDLGLGSWVGFYDWLRTSEGEVVGVRTWLHDDGDTAMQLSEVLAQNDSVDRGGHGELLIWPSGRCAFDEWMSGDQSLGTHRLLQNESGELALTFEIDALTDKERVTVDAWVKGPEG
jgi:hypothetical protein